MLSKYSTTLISPAALRPESSKLQLLQVDRKNGGNDGITMIIALPPRDKRILMPSLLSIKGSPQSLSTIMESAKKI